MSFDWEDFLRLAEELTAKTKVPPSMEARLRTAISRAYYASHCTARNHLRDVDKNPKIPDDGTAHTYVINEFSRSAEKDRRRVGTNLRRLRGDRTRADYEDSFGLVELEHTARADLLIARMVLAALTGMPPPASSVNEAI